MTSNLLSTDTIPVSFDGEILQAHEVRYTKTTNSPGPRTASSGIGTTEYDLHFEFNETQPPSGITTLGTDSTVLFYIKENERFYEFDYISDIHYETDINGRFTVDVIAHEMTVK